MVILGTKKRWCKLKFNGVDGVGLTEKTILKKKLMDLSWGHKGEKELATTSTKTLWQKCDYSTVC